MKPDTISLPVKILAAINLASVVVIYIILDPHVPKPKEMFGGLQRLINMIFVVWLVYSLCGLLVFVKRLRELDWLLAAPVVIITTWMAIAFDGFEILILGAPMAIYLVLQVKRKSLSDNFKMAYLNIWTVLTLPFVLYDFLDKI
jgi:hypothetical protein